MKLKITFFLIIMAILIWGALPKSQTDSELIEAAIARLISAHNDNEESHLLAGQSLQSHKAAEIIDHLAQSIIEDKLKDWAVTPIKFGTLIYSTIFESLDGFQITAGVAYGPDFDYVKLVTLATTNDYQTLFKQIGHFPDYWSWDHDRDFETSIKVSSVSNIYALALVGGAYNNNHIGFLVDENKLYGTIANGSAEVTVELQTISANTKYHVEAIYTSGVKCEFWVDGVLKGTLISGFPTGTLYVSAVIGVLVKTKANSVKQISLSYWDLRQKVE